MKKDFTEQKKIELIEEIDDINKSTWCSFTDGLGDMFLHMIKWLELIESDMDDVKKYHRHVLDMNNTKKSDVERIFNAVYDVDIEEKEKFQRLLFRQNEYNNKIKALAEHIRPNFVISSAETIKKEMYTYNEKMYAIDCKLNDDYEIELEYTQKAAALEATKGVVSGIVGAAVDIACLPFSMAANLLTGRYDKVVSDVWGLINSVFAVGGNLVALGSVGLSVAGSKWWGFNTAQQEYLMKYAENYGGAKGLSDVIEADEKSNGKNFITTGIKHSAYTIDTADDIYNFVSDGIDFIKEPDKLFEIKLTPNTKHEPLYKRDMLEKYTKSEYMVDKYQKIYNTYEKQAKVAKAYKTVYDRLNVGWSFVEGGDALEDEIKVLLKQTSKEYKFIDDTIGSFKDVLERKYN